VSRAVFTQIETPRLILRRFGESDLLPFVAYRSDPDIARYQGWDSLDEPRARAFIAEQQRLEPGMPGEWFQFAIALKEMGELIGDCALKANADDARQAEIGFTLARTHQGQGYATEAVTRLLEYAFAALGLHRVIAITDCRNAASVSLLERLGLRREGHFIQNVWFKGAWGDEYLYAILSAEWLRRYGEDANR
jgi:RimJ/RimL family protein N-acetyltransferase